MATVSGMPRKGLSLLKRARSPPEAVHVLKQSKELAANAMALAQAHSTGAARDAVDGAAAASSGDHSSSTPEEKDNK